MSPRKILILSCVWSFLAGILIGGFIFSSSRPRAIWALRHCDGCMDPREIAGIAASVVVRRFPGQIPTIVYETDKSVAIRHPFAFHKNHFVIFPKKDVRNIGDITEEDRDYLMDVMGVIQHLIAENHLRNYRVWTNGPKKQTVGYLHFHLAGPEPKK